ncbi:YchJ family protein [Salidesulfovibrio onnuriiensis]|uniref:YchJ family protein n=1 Tax=Salidesulfovibrio onnuriiensis TaxID=2583823 RepID=UPI0011CCC7E9|nr:YchJ family protein [Salidesulfovibrio onnuriiensis]
MKECPCGSGKDFEACCEPYITGKENAPTAEALMRSRYSAYATGHVDYLHESLAPEKQSEHDPEAVRDWAEKSEWLGLTIMDTKAGTEKDETGEVSFAAKFRQNNMVQEHREHSQFRKEDGKWFYVDGYLLPPATVRNENKVGRNEPCPCGSGKKYKKCCGK